MFDRVRVFDRATGEYLYVPRSDLVGKLLPPSMWADDLAKSAGQIGDDDLGRAGRPITRETQFEAFLSRQALAAFELVRHAVPLRWTTTPARCVDNLCDPAGRVLARVVPPSRHRPRARWTVFVPRDLRDSQCVGDDGTIKGGRPNVALAREACEAWLRRVGVNFRTEGP